MAMITSVLEFLDPSEQLLVAGGIKGKFREKDVLPWLIPQISSTGLRVAIVLLVVNPLPLLEICVAICGFCGWYWLSVAWMLRNTMETKGLSAGLLLVLHFPLCWAVWGIFYILAFLPVGVRWFLKGFRFRVDALRFLYNVCSRHFSTNYRRLQADLEDEISAISPVSTPPKRDKQGSRDRHRPPTPYARGGKQVKEGANFDSATKASPRQRRPPTPRAEGKEERPRQEEKKRWQDTDSEDEDEDLRAGQDGDAVASGAHRTSPSYNAQQFSPIFGAEATTSSSPEPLVISPALKICSSSCGHTPPTTPQRKSSPHSAPHSTLPVHRIVQRWPR
jgi:hypothetical protein